MRFDDEVEDSPKKKTPKKKAKAPVAAVATRGHVDTTTRLSSNKARRMRRHIRNHPFDKQAEQQYPGDASRLGLTERGLRRFHRANARARKRA